MSASQNYGVLRIVRVQPPAKTTEPRERRNPGWLPEERLVYLLASRETTIGRALSNNFILMDPAVSREHARLVLSDQGWCIYNVTKQNSMYVNGHPVAAGSSVAVQPQDFLLLGNTVLQLVAPRTRVVGIPSEADDFMRQLTEMQPVAPDEHIVAVSGTGDAYGVGEEADDPGEQNKETGSQQSDDRPCSVPAGQAIDRCSNAALQEQEWRAEEERFFGAGVTMQFALPRALAKRSRWLIPVIGIAVVLLSVLVFVILNNLLGFSALVQSRPLNFFVIVTIPIVPAISINLLVNFMDRFEREPWFLRLAAFLWGAIIAIPPTLLIEQYVDSLRPALLGPNPSDMAHSIFVGLNAGITEETVKGLGLLLLFMALRDEFDNVTDGIVYGALIGAGFAMVENFSYFGMHSRSLMVLLVGRIVLGWLSHSTFTVCFGAALGYIRHTRVRWQQIVIPLIGYLIAVGLHSVFDFVNFFASSLVANNPTSSNIVTFSLLAGIGNYVPPFIAQMVILYCLVKSLAHEAAIIREFLASEVTAGVVTVDEYALLQHSFVRTKVERHVLWHWGIRQWMRVKDLYQTEIGLAFRKWHVSMGERPKPGFAQPEDAYRRRIERLRHEIAEAERKGVQRFSVSSRRLWKPKRDSI